MPRLIPVVFVSSTFEDLKDYREALITAFPQIDVLFRGMEYFGSSNRRPKEVMLAQLRGSDLYLGILANRYGSLDEETGYSFTELEYRTAVKLKIPRLCYLIARNQPVPPDTVEQNPRKQRKLEAFKKVVEKELTVDRFKTPEDLARRASDGIRKWAGDSAARWKTREREGEPVSSRENNLLAQLYGEDEAARKRAFDALKNMRSAAALEHFYGILHGRLTPRETRREIVRALDAYADSERAIDVLAVAARHSDASTRSRAVFSIGDRMSSGGCVTDTALLVLEERVDDASDGVREEVAHAAGKIAVGDARFKSRCVSLLKRLKKDPKKAVRERAGNALKRVTGR